MKRWYSLVLVLVAGIGFASPSQAEDITIDSFFGNFTGSGYAASAKAEELGQTRREFDVTIAGRDGGLVVNWTTVVLGEADDSGEESEVKRNTTEIVFVPTDSANFFLASGGRNPAGEQGYSWASLKGDTLTVYIMVVSPETGSYSLHSYARTMRDENTMFLQFSRISEGRPRVIVEGELARN